MKTLSTILILALAMAPLTVSAQRAVRSGGGAPARGGSAASRPAPNQGRGFNMSNDAPKGTANGKNGAAYNGKNSAGAYNKNTGNAAVYNKNTGNKTTYNKNSNSGTYDRPVNSGAYNGKNSAGAYNKNTGNAAVYNKNTGNMTVYNKNTGKTSTYHYNGNGRNAYYYSGRVVVNPRYYGPAWGWNRGVVWTPYRAYWGGGFWGGFAIGAAVAMGSIVYANQRYTSYYVAAASPGATLLSNYGLRQVQCGPSGLVVIYGPNLGIICAEPNSLIGAGSYAVNVDNLTLQSQ